MSIEVRKEGEFEYYESDDQGYPIILLHGLMGALSNFEAVIEYFRGKNKVVLPILPLFDIPLRKLSLASLVEHVSNFIQYKGYEKVYVLGNSLGGHLALLYAQKHPEKIQGMILTGSSGLYEKSLGNTFPKRGDYEFVKKKTEEVFYNPEIATKELIDGVYATVNDLRKAMSVVALAKSAIRHNMEDDLLNIKVNTLIIWGIEDTVTPLWVGEKFHQLLENSELVRIAQTGHAPMLERPDVFNTRLEDFIHRVDAGSFPGDKHAPLSFD